MSSSTSGQWTPSPSPMISKRLRCAGVASLKRHDHAKGTLTIRPSASCATIASLVTSIATMRGSIATVLIPCLTNSVQLILDHLADPIQLFRLEAFGARQFDWIKPVFAHGFIATNMNVPWLVAVETV